MRSLKTGHLQALSVLITLAALGIFVFMIVLGGCMQPPVAMCGDNICDAAMGEKFANCPKDCPAGTCGDHLCEPAGGETLMSCPTDCKATFTCGDTACNGSENADTCRADCADTCGDRYCSNSELNSGACGVDCPTIECGDGRCDLGESRESCPQDCATVPS